MNGIWRMRKNFGWRLDWLWRGIGPMVAGLLAAGIAVSHASTPQEQVIPDRDITTAVESDLAFDPGVSPNWLDVETRLGIVTISGSVDDLLTKERAVKIAKSVRGVRAVVDEMTVRPLSRPDEDIRKDILMVLLEDPATESYEIGVTVKDQVARLTGSVGSWAERRLVERVAKEVKGVREIKNDVTIDYQSQRTDAEIKADIQERLKWDIWVNGSIVDVTVQKGKASLSGKIGSAIAKSQAVEDAWVNGVTGVDASGLTVTPWMRDDSRRPGKFVTKPDDEIRRAVLASFRYDPRVSRFSPEANVEDGAVILWGSVGNLKAKEAAATDARNTVGVTWVDNLLKVRPSNLPNDADTETHLEKVLWVSPSLNMAQIEVAVIHHVAYLSGVVDTGLQKAQAQDIASRTKGVVEVRNHLKVEPFSEVSYYDWPYHYFQADLERPPLKSDRQIETSVEKAFFWSPFVDRDDIAVTVHHGVVTLAGKVGSWIGYGEADRDARKSGAADVINQLTVRQGAWF